MKYRGLNGFDGEWDPQFCTTSRRERKSQQQPQLTKGVRLRYQNHEDGPSKKTRHQSTPPYHGPESPVPTSARRSGAPRRRLLVSRWDLLTNRTSLEDRRPSRAFGQRKRVWGTSCCSGWHCWVAGYFSSGRGHMKPKHTQETRPRVAPGPTVSGWSAYCSSPFRVSGCLLYM